MPAAVARPTLSLSRPARQWGGEGQMQTEVVDPVALERLVMQLCREFEVAAEDVRHLAHAVYAEFADARVRAFIPVLAERKLREALRAVRHDRLELSTAVSV